MTIISSSSALLYDLQYDDLSVGEQALIDALIATANDFIENKICNRIFSAANYVEILDGTGWDSIFVKNPPINSLTSLAVYSITSEDELVVSYSSTELAKNPITGEIKLRSSCNIPQGFQNVRITYNGGYVTIPPAVEQIAASFVLQYFDPKLVTDYMQKERIGDYFYDKGSTYFEKLPFSLKKMLSYYKIRSIQPNWGY